MGFYSIFMGRLGRICQPVSIAKVSDELLHSNKD